MPLPPTLPFPVTEETTAWRAGTPAAGLAVHYRVQQETVPARSMGAVILAQSDLDVHLATVARDGSRTWTSQPTAARVDAWTDFGNVAEAELSSLPRPPATRWVEHPDGTVTDMVVEGGDAAGIVGKVLPGLADQLHVPLPDHALRPGETWTSHHVLRVDAPVEDMRLQLNIVVDATYTFRGWSQVEGVRTALVASEVRLQGGGGVTAPTTAFVVSLSGRTGGWTWLDAADGMLTYALSSTELTLAKGGYDPRAEVTTIRTSIGRAP